ncbi:amino acid permease [Butyrivibrio sp. AD3002]|uniref:amino acid permease n=1 Tax=Butyrivibrio sp. AD3002 TaxID=1280670 RepID=UPI0003B73821|nr:amino acid permease [Butyrivibrio sp. AD3002]
MFKENTTVDNPKLKKCLSPIGTWALAFGCAVGWGSFVMPGTTFLPLAGPIGTMLGMILGAAVMLLIGINYHYMMNLYPDDGGTYAFSKHEFGYDQGFLGAWFLLLVYMAIVWANATAIPIICRNLFPGVLEVGPKFIVAGFEVYLVESVVASLVIGIAGFICVCGGRISSLVQTVFALVLIGGIVLVAVLITVKGNVSLLDVKPSFVPEKSKYFQVFQIVALAPWAYVGFESISHSTEEFNFSTKRTIGIMVGALIWGAIAYSLLALIAVSAVPRGVWDWTGYLCNLGRFKGFGGLPTFNAATTYLGDLGFVILGLSVAAAIITGLIGNLIAASRLIYSMARDNLFPKWLMHLNRYNVPYKAIITITCISMVIPFFGRTAISWIVDVSTIGACVAYAYTSLAAFFRAKREKKFLVRITGITGFVLSSVFALYFLIPNLWSVEALSPHSYLIIIVWSIVGFVSYFFIFKRDKGKRFGHSTLSLLSLLFLVFFISMLWFREESHETTARALDEFNEYNTTILREHGIKQDYIEKLDMNYFRDQKLKEVTDSLQIKSIAQMAVIMVALFIMFSVYRSMHRRERELELQKVKAEENSKAKSMFLSNMSHDLRTPMNAIIGYTELTKDIEGLSPEVRDNLEKIDNSGKHLLSLINDILDMGRIESGKMTLEIEDTDLTEAVDELKVLFAPQMKNKGINFTVDTSKLTNKYVKCDENRLNRVLLNLLSNAFKFTSEGGSITLTIRQRGMDGNKGKYEISVKDNGMGMSPEFAATVFEAYSRENTASKIQGTGLGMAITKSIVDLMGGKIRVKSQQGKGSEFIIDLDFETIPDADFVKKHVPTKEETEIDYSKYKVLLVEDQAINREIATRLLKKFGFQYDTAENGKIALDMISVSTPGTYSIILMDIQMPVMDGYTASREIRKLSNPELANIPILAMSASAFTEDINNAKDSGMNGHIAKPIEVNKMLDTIREFL